MSEEKSSPVGMIVGVAVVAVVIGIMIGKSGSDSTSTEIPSPASQGDNSVNEQDSKPVEKGVQFTEQELKINGDIEVKIREVISKPEGELTDDDGTVFKAGDFVRFEPNSEHSSFSENGCTALVILSGGTNKAL